MSPQLTWSKYALPSRLVDSSGRFRIEKAAPDEPGFVGHKLFDGGRHVRTEKLLRDAKQAAEDQLAAEDSLDQFVEAAEVDRAVGIPPEADVDDLEVWEWEMSGTAPRSSPGSMVSPSEDSGKLIAEGAGQVIDHLLQRGWWDGFDQDEGVTITVRPSR